MRVKDARQTFLGIWIKKILQGKPFEVWEGRQLRDFTYVDDCVDALLLAARSESAQGKIFNLGGAEDPISLDDLAKMLVQANGGGEFQRMSFPTYRRKIDIGDYYSNSDLIRNTLGWIPKVTLKEGLDRTLSIIPKICNNTYESSAKQPSGWLRVE
jgi:nucleoside-diphosphate-sugar epimerase